MHAPYVITHAPADQADMDDSDDEEQDGSYLSDTVSSLLQLPGAHSMPSSSIVALLKPTICSRMTFVAEQLVQQMSSEMLCQLLQEAGPTASTHHPSTLLLVLTRCAAINSQLCYPPNLPYVVWCVTHHNMTITPY